MKRDHVPLQQPSGRPEALRGGGFTRVPNYWLDTLLPRLDPYLAKIAVWLLRQTVGWNRLWSPPLSYRFIASALGMDKMAVMRHVKAGLQLGVLRRARQKNMFVYAVCCEEPKRVISGKNSNADNAPPVATQEAASRAAEDGHFGAYRPLSAYETVCSQHTVSSQDSRRFLKEKKKTTASNSPSPPADLHAQLTNRSFDTTDNGKHRRSKALQPPKVGSSIVSASRKLDTSPAKATEQERLERIEAIAHLPFSHAQIEILVSQFDLKTLHQAARWERTARYDDLGAAFYSACRGRWEPKKTKEQRTQEDKSWTSEEYGHLDGTIVKGYRFDILNTRVEFVASGPSQPVILAYGEPNFREKLRQVLT